MRNVSPTYAAQLAAYAALRERWRDDPLLYARQRFGLDPTWQQAQLLNAIAQPSAKVSVRSGHGTGKSASAAIVISWYLECHDFAKVPCTAPSAHQLRDILWGELSKWRRKADEMSQRRGDHPRFWLTRLFAYSTERLGDPQAPEWGAVARTARKENPEALQGFHADHLLFVLDEASGIPEEIFEAAEGALSTPGARVLMLANPTRTSGTFHASHHQHRGDYTCLHFRSQDSPLVAPEYRPRLVRKWGDGSNVVRVRADGEFPRQDDDVLIGLDLTEPCLTREPRPGTGPRKLGVDVARYGSDRTTLIARQGAVVDHAAVFSKQGTMETVGRVVQVLGPWDIEEIFVDVVGLGAGVYDRLVELREQGVITAQVSQVNASQAAPIREVADAQGRLMRDYVWLECARWLRDEEPVFVLEDKQIAEDLAGELCSVKYKPDSKGQLVVEDKDSMKKRLGHSPDLADGLCCTFAPSYGRVELW